MLLPAVSNILTLSSDFVVKFNCTESSNTSFEVEGDLVEQFMSRDATSVDPKKKSSKLLPPPPYYFQEVGRSDRFTDLIEELTDERGEEKDESNGHDATPEHRWRLREVKEHENDIPAPLSIHSTKEDHGTDCSHVSTSEGYFDVESCHSSVLQEDHHIATEGEGQSDDEVYVESTKAKLETEVTEKKQSESTSYTIYYSIKGGDKNDDITPAKRGVTKTDIKREVGVKMKKSPHSNTSSTWKRPVKITKPSIKKTMAETVRQMKKTYIQSEKREELNRNERLYQHGKRSVSARRQLARAQHEEMNKSALFEKKFQEKRRASRSTARNHKDRGLSLYDLSRSKQLEGRVRRIEIMNMISRKAELRSRSVSSSTSTSKKRYSRYSISSNSSYTTSRSTKISLSSSSHEEEKPNSLFDEEIASQSVTKISSINTCLNTFSPRLVKITCTME